MGVPLSAVAILGRKSSTAVRTDSGLGSDMDRAIALSALATNCFCAAPGSARAGRFAHDVVGLGALGGVEDDEVGVERRGLLGRQVHRERRGVGLAQLDHGRGVDEAERTQHLRSQVGGGVEADRRQVGRVEPRPRRTPALELRVGGHGIRDGLRRGGLERGGLRGPAERLADGLELALPGRPPRRDRVGHDRGDLAQLVVVLLGDTRGTGRG